LRLLRFEHPHQSFEFFFGPGAGFNLGPGLFNRLRDPLFIEGLQDVIDSVDLERFDRVLIEGGRKDDLGQGNLAIEQLLDDAETVEAGHLDVEKNEIGIVFLDQADGFEAVLALGDDVNISGVFEQVGEFVACQLFVVDDDDGKRHGVMGRTGDSGMCGGNGHTLNSEYSYRRGRRASLDCCKRRARAPSPHGRCKLLFVNILYGINTVTEALKARGRNFEWVAVAKERNDIRLKRAIEECRKIGVPVRVLSRMELDELAGNAAHQGLVAATSAKQYSHLDDIVASRRGEHSLIVVLDGVEDPHNLGAILRTADAAGADGVVIPERRSAAVTAAVAKVSAGASEHLPIAKVTNISRALEDLKEKDLWVVGLDERGEQTYDAIDYKMHCAVVLGAEGKGIHDLVRRHCDFLVSIPMMGQVPSLNVSVAAGVMLYEVVRQRRAGASKKA